MLKIILLVITFLFLSVSPIFAVSDPRVSPNNKVGINVMSPEAEVGNAATLVNTNGDWGWIVITITKDQRDVSKLQSILNQANQNHLIPIIRLATQFDAKNGYWLSATDEDAKSWADFLSQLYFPTKNRYIEVYNEVNRAAEWGGKVDSADYARQLNNTIDALKAKSDNFFVLNAPLDLSLVNSKDSQDAGDFLAGMQNSVSGIFSKLDGWASHSYPNPNFSSSPYKAGRIGIDGYSWELTQISKYTEKDLPVFITETGWKRSDSGKDGISENLISKYYQQAFENVWNDKRIVAVAPFLLSYPDPLFNQFAFQESTSVTGSAFYKYFSTIQNLPKIKGAPVRENLISDFKINKEDYILENIGSSMNIEFKNVGNYVWNSQKDLNIKILGQNIIVNNILWDKEEIYPGQEVKATVKIKSISQGSIPLTIIIVDDNKVLDKKEIAIKSETLISFLGIKIKSASAVFKAGTADAAKLL